MVEVCDMDNEPLVRMVGGSAVETVVSHDIIGRLMIQCARQPGLATVWEQLMGFDGGCSHEGLQGTLSSSLPSAPLCLDQSFDSSLQDNEANLCRPLFSMLTHPGVSKHRSSCEEFITYRG